MTANEIQMLITGAALGGQAVSFLHMYWSRRDARRAAVAAQAVDKRAAGDRFLSSLTIYKIEHRSRV